MRLVRQTAAHVTEEDLTRSIDVSGGRDDIAALAKQFNGMLNRLEGAFVEQRRFLDDAGHELRTRRVGVDGDDVDLTARGFALLELLMRHPGQVLTRQQMLSHVWGHDHDPGTRGQNVVDVFVRALRRKVGARRIETVRGMG